MYMHVYVCIYTCIYIYSYIYIYIYIYSYIYIYIHIYSEYLYSHVHIYIFRKCIVIRKSAFQNVCVCVLGQVLFRTSTVPALPTTHHAPPQIQCQKRPNTVSKET